MKNKITIYPNIKAALEPAKPEEALTLPAALYTDEQFLEMEYQSIFENTWQLVGHKSQLNNVGDQMVCQVGRVPIVVVRNQENILKAFHNVCRHRAGPVATENANSKILRCKYHGWSYTLDGDLKTAPEMSSTPNFDVCQFHLPQASIKEWQGFIFVCVGDSPPKFEEVFAGIADTIKPIDLSKMSFSHRDEYLIDCNWKVYMDNYLEGYHLPHVHPGLSKLLDYRSYDTILHDWFSYQFSPLDGNDSESNFYGEGHAHYYCIYPNLMLNILPGRLQTNVILPAEGNQTRIIFDYYYEGIGSENTEKLIQQDTDFSDEIQEEDIQICQRVQQGLNSGSYQAGRLCMKRETGVLHFQNLVRQSLRQCINDSNQNN